MELTTEQLSELDHDGAVLKLDDERTLRVRVEPDMDTSVMDEEFYGTFAWVERDRDYGRDKPRPEGFTGRAVKMSTSRGDSYWWEPPSGDYALTGTEKDLEDFRLAVKDLVEWGFKGVVLELLSGTDAYGRPIVIDVASLWGIDSLEDGYLESVVADLAYEIDIEPTT